MFPDEKKIPGEDTAVIVIVGGGGGIAVLIGLYKVDAIGKLGK